MSLAVTTASSLTIVDGAFIKRETSYDPFTTPTHTTPIAHAWSHDNNIVYLASVDSIYSFTPSSNELSLVYSASKNNPLHPTLISCDKSSLIFAQGSAIHVLAVGSLPSKISNTLIGHSSSITSLSLSYDGSLLASSSTSGTLCVHNLAHNSLTILKGLPPGAGSAPKNIVCSFHPHIRTRLLVGYARALFVYDVTRPTTPIKTIALTEKDKSGAVSNTGNIVAISSSPFSKSLTAVAFTSGNLILLDLDKDRPLLKTLQLKVPITSMSFTMDGACIALGTEHGKIILKEWRSVANDHRTLSIGTSNGERIVGISIQRRIKTSAVPPSSVTKRGVTVSKPKPFSEHDLNHANVTSPTAYNQQRLATPLKPMKTNQKAKTTFSPPKGSSMPDEEDISVQIEALMDADTVKPSDTARKTSNSIVNGRSPTSERSRVSSSRKVSSSSASSRSRLSPNAQSRGLQMKSNPSSTVAFLKTDGTSISSPAENKTVIGTQCTDTLKNALSSVRPTSRQTSINGDRILPKMRPKTSFSKIISPPSVESLRLPSPGLSSDGDLLPAKQFRAVSKTSTNFETPDIDRWFEAGKGKEPLISRNEPSEKRVGWAISSPDNVSEQERESNDNPDKAVNKCDSAEISVVEEALLSGRNLTPPVNTKPYAASRISPEPFSGPGMDDWMQTLLNNMSYNYRREMKEDIKGLHLDLLRIGRTWKTELRSLMEDYVVDLKELIDENSRLREENERLKRGF